MKLTSHTDFGLRVLMTLAAAPERRFTIEDLAQRHRLSRNHLMKVAQSLVHAGAVVGLRGRAGGLKLARNPQDIRVGAIVRALEDDTGFVACFGDGPATCIFDGVCRFTEAIQRSLDAFFAELDRVTLAELVAPRRSLRTRLGLDPTNQIVC